MNTGFDRGPIILAPGAKVTCENGHYVCTVGHEMVASPERAAVKSEWFVEFAPQHYKPGPGDKAAVCVCGICGAPWIAERPGWWSDGQPGLIPKLHLEAGWWP